MEDGLGPFLGLRPRLGPRLLQHGVELASTSLPLPLFPPPHHNLLVSCPPNLFDFPHALPIMQDSYSSPMQSYIAVKDTNRPAIAHASSSLTSVMSQNNSVYANANQIYSDGSSITDFTPTTLGFHRGCVNLHDAMLPNSRDPEWAEAVRTLDHNALWYSRNRTYIDLYMANQYAQSNLKQVLGQMKELTMHTTTLAPLPLQLAPAPAAASECPKPLVPFESYMQLSKDSYKHVRFWKRGQWKAWSDGRNAHIDGGNITMLYVEMEDSEPIDGERASEICEELRRIFRTLNRVGFAAEQFRMLTTDPFRYFMAEAYRQFPEFRLCARHWKLKLAGGTAYSAWYRAIHKAKARAIKIEEELPLKRAASPTPLQDAPPHAKQRRQKAALSSSNQPSSSLKKPTPSSSKAPAAPWYLSAASSSTTPAQLVPERTSASPAGLAPCDKSEPPSETEPETPIPLDDDSESDTNDSSCSIPGSPITCLFAAGSISPRPLASTAKPSIAVVAASGPKAIPRPATAPKTPIASLTTKASTANTATRAPAANPTSTPNPAASAPKLANKAVTRPKPKPKHRVAAAEPPTATPNAQADKGDNDKAHDSRAIFSGECQELMVEAKGQRRRAQGG
ncbi:hypothetical protein BOTBODRAFT_178043 [Botryobasidium botryosum FD-172 SS1]|uniref:Uncharacterized protein n=1 Tax=Botryobasidium botryosum (strain FD-172 SS1) TaxID=930990 RepID=A0A067MFA3_BOTB1|nr:hypothetical protein BOTBODRAFT_178043 [Botryobasidium botryosum FD-172 SS1]